MPYIKVYIHIVWSTKNRIPFLKNRTLRLAMWKHLKGNAHKKGIHLDHVSGYSDHCHCLISLNNDQSLKNVIQLLKGESAYWINNSKLIKEFFEWQDEYFAVSVSESMIEKVRAYIKNQEEHHKTITFADEHQDFIQKFKFKESN